MSNSHAFTKCINDNGDLAFTYTICPKGFKPIKEYGEIKNPSSTKGVTTVPEHKKNVNAQKIIDNITFRVLESKKINKKENRNPPKEGNEFLAVLIQIANTTDLVI